MKWSIVLLSLFVTLAFSCGQKKEGNKKQWIYDYEKILTSHQERYLESVISDYERKTSNEIVIVTSKDIEDELSIHYAAEFGIAHEVGKKGKNNGLVIFVSKNLKQTALTTGYENDKSLNNEICKKIVDSCMIPCFKEEKYFDGIKAGLNECIKKWK
jgi:uncharacterized protein